MEPLKLAGQRAQRRQVRRQHLIDLADGFQKNIITGTTALLLDLVGGLWCAESSSRVAAIFA